MGFVMMWGGQIYGIWHLIELHIDGFVVQQDPNQ